VVAHIADGFHGFDLFALALSATPPFVAAGWWLARWLRRRRGEPASP
jgi:hypothetical protein